MLFVFSRLICAMGSDVPWKVQPHCSCDHCGGNHFAYCVDPYHETTADDDVMTAHQIFT